MKLGHRLGIVFFALAGELYADRVYTNNVPVSGCVAPEERIRVVYMDHSSEPVMFSGECRTEDAVVSIANEIGLALTCEVEFTDGSKQMSTENFFDSGTHNWERYAQVVWPRNRKVRAVTLKPCAENYRGRIEFRNVVVSRGDPGMCVESVRRVSDIPRSHEEFVRVSFPEGCAPTNWVSVASDGTRGAGTCGSHRDGRIALVPIHTRDGGWIDLKMMRDGHESHERIFFDKSGAVASFMEPQTVRVWACDSSTRIYGCDFPKISASSTGMLDLARKGRGAVEVAISTGPKLLLEHVDVALGEFKSKDGTAFRGKVAWQRIGYVPRGPRHYVVPGNPFEKQTFWTPDPLLPAAPFDVVAGTTRAVWVSFVVDEQCAAGVYSGNVIVRSNGLSIGEARISVRVRSFSLPRTFGMPLTHTSHPFNTKARYGDRAVAIHEALEDLLLDHRVIPDCIDRMIPPKVSRAQHWIEKGAPRFCMLTSREFRPTDKHSDYDAYWPPDICRTHRCEGEKIAPGCYEAFRDRIRPAYEAYVKAGIAKRAYFYGFDEKYPRDFPVIEKFDQLLKRDFPDLKFMTTARMMENIAAQRNDPDDLMIVTARYVVDSLRVNPYGYKPEELTFTDVHCPATMFWNHWARDLIKSKGKEVWWYVFSAPLYPYANFSGLENPPIDGVVLGWQTWFEESDGLLFWLVNGGPPGLVHNSADPFFSDFLTGMYVPGDGVLVYPIEDGYVDSIRLAKSGEGVQFYEWLQMAAERCGRARVCEIIRKINTDMMHFSRDPDLVAQIRKEVGDLIEGE